MIAQDSQKKWIKFNASLSQGNLVRYFNSVDGSPSYDFELGYLLGIGYIHKINERLELETGLDYSRSRYKKSYAGAMGEMIEDVNLYHIDLLTVPLNLRFKLNRNFVITAGLLCDIETSIIDSRDVDEQSGIGINLKIGKDFLLNNKTILCITPELLIHGVVPFYHEKNYQNLTVLGLRVSYIIGL